MTVRDCSAPADVIGRRGNGKVFLFGCEGIPCDPERASLPEIEHFLVNVFAWLSDCEIQPIFK